MSLNSRGAGHCLVLLPAVGGRLLATLWVRETRSAEASRPTATPLVSAANPFGPPGDCAVALTLKVLAKSWPKLDGEKQCGSSCSTGPSCP